MKILLIVPNIEGRIGYPPYNVALLKTFIEARTKHEARIADLSFYKKNWRHYLKDEIDKEQFDLIGISVLSFDYLQGLSIAAFIKEQYKIKIIFGGIHVILMPDEVISHQEVDMVCTGEGEYALKEILDNDLNCQGIKGIWYKDNEQVIKNEQRELLENLDELPFPEWNSFELEKYFLANTNHLALMVSRGCPYSCTYCNNHVLKKILKGKYVRFRSVDSAIEEIGQVIDKYYDRGFRYIHFIDDNFALHKDWTLEFCRKYKEKGYDKIVKWMISLRAELIDDEVIAAVTEAGCYEVGMGIEAANDFIRKEVYKRNMSKSQIYEAMETIKRHGPQLRIQFIIGAPFETPDMMQESFEMAKEINADVIQFSLLMPLPGTEIRKICKGEGLLEAENLKHSQLMYSSPVVSSKYASAKEIKTFYKKVRNYQIKKYIWEGLKMKGPLFLWDLLVFLFYFKPKYELEIQNAFKFTVKKYMMEKVSKS